MSEPSPPISLLPADTAVLLVLLAAPISRLASGAGLAGLRVRLGNAVRVLCIDAASHPSVVSSFHATELPCFVLVYQGVELWRASVPPDFTSTATPDASHQEALIEELVRLIVRPEFFAAEPPGELRHGTSFSKEQLSKEAGVGRRTRPAE